ncbi:hypothetical protein EON65_21860 [archaeon]|nr:MAG: hypothetical protein EON65_21860 [archaeon]
MTHCAVIMARFLLFLAFLLSFVYCVKAEVAELTNEEALDIYKNLEHDPHRTPLFIEFYAPWCSKCKAFQPILNKLADYAHEGGHIRVVKINGAKHKESAKVFGVDKFPTFVYIKDGHTGFYDGPRVLDTMKEFVDKVKLPTYTVLQNNEDVYQVTQNMHFENVSFVLSLPCTRLDSSCSGDYGTIVANFEFAAMRFSMEAVFIVALHQKTPTLCKLDSTVPDLVPLCLEGIADMKDKAVVTDFVRMHNYPLIAHMENHNFHRLANLQTKMLLAVLDTKKHDSDVIMAGFQDAAKVYEREHPDMRLILGVLDGKRWHSFCKVHRATVPSFLLLNHATDEHAKFPITSVHNQMSIKEQVTEIIQGILEERIEMEKVVPLSFVGKIKYRIERYMPWSLLLLIAPILLIVSSLCFPRPRKAKNM